MERNLSCVQSLPPSELNALAPLRVGAIAHRIFESAEDPAKVRELAQELIDLEPHILTMLIDRGEALPE